MGVSRATASLSPFSTRRSERGCPVPPGSVRCNSAGFATYTGIRARQRSNGEAFGSREPGLRHRIGGAARVRCGSRSAAPMRALAFILALVYIATPAVMAGVAGFKSFRARSIRSASGFLVTCASGIVIGASMAVLFAVAAGGGVRVGQVLLTSYFSIAALCLLKALSLLLERGTLWMFGAARPVEEVPLPRYYRTRFTGAFVVRALLLYAIGLPYIMALGMVYRPKVFPGDNPFSQLGFQFETVRFASTDGVRLDGWWIPARPPSAADLKEKPDWGTRTVVLCHGLGANKANQLIMAQDLVPGGYNVLAFDFRAHGMSGGQLSSFGDLERRDVL